MDEVEELQGTDVGTDLEEEGEVPSEFSRRRGAPVEEPEEYDGFEGSAGEEPEEEEPPVQRPARRQHSSTEDMTEAEFEAYMASKNKRGSKRQPKEKGAGKGKKGKEAPITLGKSAGSGTKKGSRGKGAPAKEPAAIKPGFTGGAAKKGTKSTKPVKPSKQKDDFDEMFGGHEEGNMPVREPALSQIITLLEVAAGMGLAFFGASQLGNILITNIMSGG